MASIEVKSSLTYMKQSILYERQYMITLKMADQRWFDIYVVFTKILCGRNFCVW